MVNDDKNAKDVVLEGILTGRKFEQLSVLRLVGNQIFDFPVWECKCDCGRTIFVPEQKLISGKVKSCGCSQNNVTIRSCQVTSGKRFGMLLTITSSIDSNTGKRVWECKCDCGKTIFVKEDYLRKGIKTSCGCVKRAKIAERHIKALSGKVFGSLSLVRPVDAKAASRVWECKCQCGNTVFVREDYLRTGKKVSCGCLNKKNVKGFPANDLTGQKFNLLTAIRPTEKRVGGGVVWECKCDCGNVIFVRASYLKSGQKKSCGCSKVRL